MAAMHISKSSPASFCGSIPGKTPPFHTHSLSCKQILSPPPSYNPCTYAISPNTNRYSSSTRGIANTYGVFQTYYSTVFLASTSTSSISWIGAVQAMLLVFGGLFTGSLFDTGHTRPLIATGTLGLVFGTMMLSLCHTYWQIFLAQAVMVGCGLACFIIPSLAVLPQCFQERRAFAMGVGISGSSVGEFIAYTQLSLLLLGTGGVKC